MKKYNLLWAKITLGLGLLIIISTSLNTKSGANLSTFTGGNILFFGSLAYMARRKQQLSPSTKWRVTEIISVLIVLYLTFIGLISGGWYLYPVSLLTFPLLVIIPYCIALYRGTRKKVDNKTPLNDKGDYSELEKLAELKEKGVITEAEFTAKKKKVLEI